MENSLWFSVASESFLPRSRSYKSLLPRSVPLTNEERVSVSILVPLRDPAPFQPDL